MGGATRHGAIVRRVSRVVVIGAGVGGLACAARLAAAGHRVNVFEQAPVVGGKLGRHEHRTAEGVFRFDTGPSLLTLPQAFADLFAATGSTVERELDLVRLDPIVRHIFPDGVVLDSSSDSVAFGAHIAATLGPRAASDWQRLWHRAATVWSASWRHVLRSSVDSPWTLARLAWRMGDLAVIGPGRTLRGLGRSYLSDPHLRVLLDRYATYTGSDPRRAPAALVAIPYAELTFGGWYLRGGLGTLADALVARCEALGVKIHTSAPVARVEISGGQAIGVRMVDGARVPAEVVVANADAAAVYRDLLPTPARARRLIDRSMGGFVLLLGVRGRTPGLAHHTVFFPPDYDAEFDAIFGSPARAAPDPTVFVTVAPDPSVRPEGHEAWFVLVNAPPQSSVDWRAPGMAQAYADRVLATLAARGVDIRDRILFRDIRTPADLESSTLTPGGAIYGTPRHGLAGLYRPPNRGPVRGLYLVGGSTHPGGGLPMVAISAEIVAAQTTMNLG
jgi:phytoene desaturase